MKKTRVIRESEAAAQSVVMHPASGTALAGLAVSQEIPGQTRWPVRLASAASLTWLAGAAYLAYLNRLDFAESGLTLQDAALLVAGFASPIILFWLVALVVQQINPVARQRGALALGLDDLLHPVQIAERRVEALAAVLRQKIDDISAAGDLAGERVKTLESHLGEQIRGVYDVTAVAENRTQAIQRTLTSEREGLQALLTEMEHRTTEIRMMTENLAETLRRAAGDVRTEARAAGETLTEQTALLTSSSRQMVQNLEDIGANLLNFTGKMHETSLVAEQTVARIAGSVNEQQASLSETLDGLAARTEKLRTDMSETQSALDHQSHLILQTAETTAASMGASLAQLTEQTDKLAASAGAANDKLDRVGATLDSRDLALRQLGDRLEAELEKAEEATRARAAHLDEISKNLNILLEDSVLRMKAQSGELGAAAKSALDELEHSSQGLEARLNEIREASSLGAEEVQRAANALKLDLQASLSETGDAAGRLQETGSRLREDQSELMIRYDATLENIKAISASVNQQMAGVTEAAADAGARAEHIAAVLAASARDVESASSGASTAADLATRVLASQTEGLMKAASEIRKTTDDLLALSHQLEEKTSARTDGDFARTSAFVIESLASQAIDIHRVLDVNIPDDVWQQYLKGDRSVFARRTVRLGNRETKDLIARKFREDGEFREHTLRYIKEFEKLMANALAADPQGPLSITLVSSEMGKLYVLLAQSLNRLA